MVFNVNSDTRGEVLVTSLLQCSTRRGVRSCWTRDFFKGSITVTFQRGSRQDSRSETDVGELYDSYSAPYEYWQQLWNTVTCLALPWDNHSETFACLLCMSCGNGALLVTNPSKSVKILSFMLHSLCRRRYLGQWTGFVQFGWGQFGLHLWSTGIEVLCCVT